MIKKYSVNTIESREKNLENIDIASYTDSHLDPIFEGFTALSGYQLALFHQE